MNVIHTKIWWNIISIMSSSKDYLKLQRQLPIMASSSSSFISSSLIQTQPLSVRRQNHHQLFPCVHITKVPKKPLSFIVRATKLPAGVELPKVEPEFRAPFLGFTRTAEIWNSRACMIGLIGTFIVELIFNKGILEMIGVEIGKGLDIPL